MSMPFAPTYGQTKTLNASTSSSSVNIQTGQKQMYVANEGTVTVFIKSGVGSQTADATDFPLLPGQAEVLTKGHSHDTVAAVTASGTAKVFVNPGPGS